jgi:DNA-binding protein H-NS
LDSLEINNMASVSELLAQKAALEQQIAEAQRAERSGAVAQVRALMAEHGLTLADLSSKSASPKRTGAKVAPKYRDAATGDTWSGRGLQPKWLKQALASGKKIGDFAI